MLFFLPRDGLNIVSSKSYCKKRHFMVPFLNHVALTYCTKRNREKRLQLLEGRFLSQRWKSKIKKKFALGN